MNGTLKYCMKFVLKLFTFHGMKNNHYVILLFCILPNKEKETFIRLFNFINNMYEELNLLFRPEAFVVVFEDSIHLATCPNKWM